MSWKLSPWLEEDRRVRGCCSREWSRRRPAHRFAHFPQSFDRGHGQVRRLRLDARGPGPFRHGVHHRGGAPRTLDRRRRARTSSTSWTRAATRCCPIRPAASRPTTPCAWPAWAAKFSSRWKIRGPIGSSWKCWATRKTLLPDPVATLEATEKLVAEGFQVLCLHQRRPRTGPAAERRRGHQRDARRQPHRLRPGRAEPQCPPHLPGVSQGGRSAITR